MWSDTTFCHSHCDDSDSCYSATTTNNKPEKSIEEFEVQIKCTKKN
jgi:hypothetical protein